MKNPLDARTEGTFQESRCTISPAHKEHRWLSRPHAAAALSSTASQQSVSSCSWGHMICFQLISEGPKLQHLLTEKLMQGRGGDKRITPPLHKIEISVNTLSSFLDIIDSDSLHRRSCAEAKENTQKLAGGVSALTASWQQTVGLWVCSCCRRDNAVWFHTMKPVHVAAENGAWRGTRRERRGVRRRNNSSRCEVRALRFLAAVLLRLRFTVAAVKHAFVLTWKSYGNMFSLLQAQAHTLNWMQARDLKKSKHWGLKMPRLMLMLLL